MYKVKSKTKISEVVTLDEAMKLAKEMNELVTIEGDAIEIIDNTDVETELPINPALYTLLP